MLYILTTWFGSFRFNDNENIDEYTLFPKNQKEISKKLSMIASNQILPEEQQLAKKQLNIIVNQKRLRSLGHYNPKHPFFKKKFLDSSFYNYSNKLLHKSSLTHASQHISNQLLLDDFQIIQKTHTIDDLLHCLNLIEERINTWKIFSIANKNLKPLHELINLLKNQVNQLQDEIKHQVSALAPNTTSLIGPLLTARLISHAGSIEKLAKMPASSIQLLGAEKALFLFKKDGGKPPKHGILFQHEYILKSPKKNKGKIARLLALKIIIAIRADFFTKHDYGNTLKNELEKRIKKISK
jgi:RNA processing factor Prp31